MAQVDKTMERAELHAKAVRDFLYHLMTFLFVIALLVIIDVRAGTGGQAIVGLDWAYWVILPWGFGVAAHAVYAFAGEHRLYKYGRQGPLSH